MCLLGLTVIFSYLYSINNRKYMPKNKLFKSQNYSLKNYSFYFFTHFIFENALKFHFEIFHFNLYAAQNINLQMTLEQPLHLQS